LKAEDRDESILYDIWQLLKKTKRSRQMENFSFCQALKLCLQLKVTRFLLHFLNTTRMIVGRAKICTGIAIRLNLKDKEKLQIFYSFVAYCVRILFVKLLLKG